MSHQLKAEDFEGTMTKEIASSTEDRKQLAMHIKVATGKVHYVVLSPHLSGGVSKAYDSIGGAIMQYNAI